MSQISCSYFSEKHVNANPFFYQSIQVQKLHREWIADKTIQSANACG